MFNSHEARVHRGYLGLGVTRAIGVHRCFFRAPGTPKLPSPSTPKGAEKWPFYAFLSEKRPKLPWNIFRWNFPPDFWYACVKRPKMQQKKTIFWSPILKIVLVKIWGVQNPSYGLFLVSRALGTRSKEQCSWNAFHFLRNGTGVHSFFQKRNEQRKAFLKLEERLEGKKY